MNDRRRTRRKRKTTHTIPERTLQEIRAEARAFGLSTTDYLKLSTDLSRLLRQSIPSSETVKPEQWHSVVNNPIIGLAIKSISALIANSNDTDDADHTEGTPPTQSEPQKNPASPGPSNVIPYEYWYM